ncbi:MAG: MscL family protein [Firmicutes bacterium]|nr:MscL family protein [Bacillota bacterium]
MGLAIGFILGGAVSRVVTSLVQDIVSSVIGLVLGRAGNLSGFYLTLGPAKIMWGNFLSVLIDFLVVAAVVYWLFRVLGVEKLDKKA